MIIRTRNGVTESFQRILFFLYRIASATLRVLVELLFVEGIFQKDEQRRVRTGRYIVISFCFENIDGPLNLRFVRIKRRRTTCQVRLSFRKFNSNTGSKQGGKNDQKAVLIKMRIS